MTARMIPSLLVCALTLAAAPVLGQQPTPAQQPKPVPPPTAPPVPTPVPPPAPPAPRREGQPINVKVELTISDQRGTATPSKKTVTVIVADGMSGFIRSTSNYYATPGGHIEAVPLNVDVDPQILSDGKIRLRLGVQYDSPGFPASPTEAAARGGTGLYTTQLRENLAVIVDNGKSIVAAQSADPVGDRQVTLEVKATVMR